MKYICLLTVICCILSLFSYEKEKHLNTAKLWT